MARQAHLVAWGPETELLLVVPLWGEWYRGWSPSEATGRSQDI